MTTADYQPAVDEILARLGVQIRHGQLIVHLHDWRVARLETVAVYRPEEKGLTIVARPP